MNVVTLFSQYADQKPNAPALFIAGSGRRPITFGELKALATQSQREWKRLGLQPGDAVLFFYPLSVELYAAIIGALGLGLPILLVEPWMPIARISKVIEWTSPKAFYAHWLGKLWGTRVKRIRSIPHWVSAHALFRSSGSNSTFETVDVDADHVGIITFTSGSTGNPKGVVRKHGYLAEQNRILSESLGSSTHPSSDLVIFANFALANLANGRMSAIVPPAWKEKHFQEIERLPSDLLPRTLTCGPAFLRRISESGSFPSLREIHVGGALEDNANYEKAMRARPETHFTLLYGGTEVEPVCTIELGEAVRRSRDAGFEQTLALGSPIPQVSHRIDDGTAWVSGPHVCPEYIGDAEENAKNKRRDPDGRLWHNMGDRIDVRDGEWWYLGRSNQKREDFLLEQALYSFLGSSAAFLSPLADGAYLLLGEGVKARAEDIRSKFPQISRVIQSPIVRDRRHRARIDRGASLRKAGIRV